MKEIVSSCVEGKLIIVCFMKLRKIYNPKRMKQHLPFQGSVIRYMRKPRMWKTAF